MNSLKVINIMPLVLFLQNILSLTITQRMADGLQVFVNKFCVGFLINTGQTELLTKNYGEELVKSQCWTKYEEGHGTGLDAR